MYINYIYNTSYSKFVMDMVEPETFCLRLAIFGKSIRTTWQQLQGERDLCDITLECKDGKILTNKTNILHSSLVFKNILNLSLIQNPVIYLREATV